MTCPFEDPECPHPAYVAEVLHYMCRACTNGGCENKVSAIGAAECTPCMLDSLKTKENSK